MEEAPSGDAGRHLERPWGGARSTFEDEKAVTEAERRETQCIWRGWSYRALLVLCFKWCCFCSASLVYSSRRDSTLKYQQGTVYSPTRPFQWGWRGGLKTQFWPMRTFPHPHQPQWLAQEWTCDPGRANETHSKHSWGDWTRDALCFWGCWVGYSWKCRVSSSTLSAKNLIENDTDNLKAASFIWVYLGIVKNWTWTVNFQMFKMVLEKAEEPEIKLPTSAGSSKKQESSRKTSISSWLCQSLWLSGSQ